MNKLNLFWEEFKKIKHAKKYGMNQDTEIRKMEALQKLTFELTEQELQSHPYILKVKNGTTITNNFNKKIKFQLGE